MINWANKNTMRLQKFHLRIIGTAIVLSGFRFRNELRSNAYDSPSINFTTPSKFNGTKRFATAPSSTLICLFTRHTLYSERDVNVVRLLLELGAI